MAGVPDLYGVLGVGRDASDDDIRRAYRRLARELHPDVNDDPEAERRFKEITAAYQTLSDPARRRQYDLFGGRTGSGGVPQDWVSFTDLGDIFDVFFGGGPGSRRRGGRRRTRTARGQDLGVDLELSFEEAAFGIRRDVVLQTLERCERCQGTGCEPGTHPSRCARCGGSGEVQDLSRSMFGTVMTSRPCAACEGTGEQIASPCAQCRAQGVVPAEDTVTVEVPAGVADGVELRLSGNGAQGRHGGPRGDLYVALRVAPHPLFERRGQDLVCELVVPMTQAALGTEVEIPTLESPQTVRLEPGTETGAVLRLRGQGLPHLGRRGRGDLLVSVRVETPVPSSKEERALLERLAELRGERQARHEGLAGKLRKLLQT